LGTTKPGVLLRQRILFRTFADWNDERLGLFEGDLVPHGGDTTRGDYLHTLALINVVIEWTDLGLAAREQKAMLTAIDRIRSA